MMHAFKEKNINIIRVSIICLGIFQLLLSFFLLFKSINTSQLNSSTSIFELLSIDYSFYVFLFLIGCFILMIGISWKNIFKSITNILISIAILCLFFSFLLIPLKQNSANIVKSVQPSIDELIASVLPNAINDSFETYKNNINILLSKNFTIKRLYVKNISVADSRLFTDLFGINANDKDSIAFAKVLISVISKKIKEENSQYANLPISLTQLQSMVSSQIDLTILKQINISQITSFFHSDETASILILVSDEELQKSINLENITNEDINLIWDNLQFSDSISNPTKEAFIDIILSTQGKEMENMNMKGIVIPVASVGYMIPESVKKLFDNDIFNSNLTQRGKEVTKFRNSCSTINDSEKEIREVCDLVELTKYENFMHDISQGENNSFILSSAPESFETLPFNIVEVANKYPDMHSVKDKIEDTGNIGYTFLWIFIVLIIVSHIVYFAHFYVFNREFEILHIPYFVSKTNLWQYIPTYILFVIFYFLMKGDFLKNLLTKTMSSTTTGAANLIDFGFIFHMPLYNELMKINYYSFILASIYLVLSIIIYLVLYFLLKKQQAEDKEIEKPKALEDIQTI